MSLKASFGANHNTFINNMTTFSLIPQYKQSICRDDAAVREVQRWSAKSGIAWRLSGAEEQAAGPGGITSRLLHCSADQLADLFTIILNKPLVKSVIPPRPRTRSSYWSWRCFREHQLLLVPSTTEPVRTQTQKIYRRCHVPRPAHHSATWTRESLTMRDCCLLQFCPVDFSQGCWSGLGCISLCVALIAMHVTNNSHHESWILGIISWVSDFYNPALFQYLSNKTKYHSGYNILSIILTKFHFLLSFYSIWGNIFTLENILSSKRNPCGFLIFSQRQWKMTWLKNLFTYTNIEQNLLNCDDNGEKLMN